MEALEPLRQRFNAQHYGLRKFYYECSNLKYLTGLINVPKLGHVGRFSVLLCLLLELIVVVRNHRILLIMRVHLTYLPAPRLPLNRQHRHLQHQLLTKRLSASKRDYSSNMKINRLR
jgi:ANTH domain